MATAYSGTSSTSMAAAAATTGFLPLVSAHTLSRGLALPYLPTRRFQGVASKNFSGTESQRFPLLKVKATSTEESSIDAGELFNDLKEKWDAVENKSAVILYGGGAVVAVWFSSTVVGAINSVPLLPKLMELVGLGYTGWFVYRYLLFKSSRKELAEDIDSLKKKIAGTE